MDPISIAKYYYKRSVPVQSRVFAIGGFEIIMLNGDSPLNDLVHVHYV